VKKLWETLKTRSVERLTRVAAVLALMALGIIVFSVLFPRPLPVIFAMSAGHAIGGLAFACYLLAVLLDVSRSGTKSSSVAPGRAPAEGAAKE
jgi:hypothetical protein